MALTLSFSGLYTSLSDVKKADGTIAYINANGFATTKAADGYVGTVAYSGGTMTVGLKGVATAYGADNKITVAAGSGTATGTWKVTGSSQPEYFVINDSKNGGTISGGLGNDTFDIQGGDKLVVDGGAGADLFQISATAGAVSMYGGLGKDTFDFRSAGSGATATFLSGGYNPDEDIILSSGSSIGSNVSTMTADAAGTLVSSNGVLSLGNVSVTLPGTYNGTDYYKTKIQDANGNPITVYAGSNTATTVNGSAETSSIIVIGNNNTESDVLRGGSAGDYLYAGSGDSVLGGRGNDTINISTTSNNTGTSVGFSETAKAGDDVLVGARLNVGNTFTEEATSFYLGNGRLGTQFKGVTFDTTNGNITLKGQDGTLTINNAITAGAANGSMNAVVSDAGGSYNTTFFADTLTAVAEKNAQIYYSAATKGALDFSGVTSDLVVDLANSGGQGDESTYYNVAMVQAGNGNNVVMVGGAAQTTLVASGGQTSMWGAGASNDSLVGGSGRDFFGLSTKSGKDTVENFTTGNSTYSDVVYLVGTGLASVKKSSSNAMTFTGTDGSSLVMKNVVGGSDDDVIGYTTDGETITYGKVGTSGTKSTFTYDSSVVAYVGGKAGSTLNVYNADATVWLDGNMGVGYQNIGVVDASSVSGNAVLGGTAANETLIGGTGASTLWGAAGNDSLVGGSGNNTFVVGAGEGNNTIVNGKASDVVMLYNVASTGVSGSTVKNGNLTVSFRNGGSFTVNDYLNGPSTFNTTDGTYTVNGDGTIDFAKNA